MTSEANKVDPDFLDKALNMKLPRDTILATLQATSKGTSFDYEKAAASLIVIAQQLEEGQTAGLGEPQEVSRKRKLDEQGEERGEHLKPAKPRGVPHAKPAQTEQKAAKSKASPKQKSPSNGQPQSLKEMVQSGVLRPGPHVSVRLNIKGHSIMAEGSLSKDGLLVDSADGIAYESPSGWAKACIEKSGLVGKCNGWKSVLYAGKPLDSYR